MTIPLSPPQFMGLFLIAIVCIAVGWVALRKQPTAIKVWALALLAVGLGYLATTEAPITLMRMVFGEQY